MLEPNRWHRKLLFLFFWIHCSISVLLNCFDISVFQINQNVISKQIITITKILFEHKNHKMSRHLAVNLCRINWGNRIWKCYIRRLQHNTAAQRESNGWLLKNQFQWKAKSTFWQITISFVNEMALTFLWR